MSKFKINFDFYKKYSKLNDVTSTYDIYLLYDYFAILFSYQKNDIEYGYTLD